MADQDASSPNAKPMLHSNEELGLEMSPPESESLAGDLDWDGPDDPDNARNWPLWQRILHTAIPAVWSFGLCAGISSLVAAIPLLQVHFDLNSRNVALLPVTLYTAGFSFGPCIASPISELYGRRCIYWTNLSLLIIFEPLSLLLGLYTAYSFAMIFSFFGSYPYIYSTIYHFNARQVGLVYIPVIIGFLLAVITFGYFDAIKYQRVAQSEGKIVPENRLYAALFGSPFVPIGLFWYAWAPRESVHWIVPAIGGLWVGWGTLTGFLSVIAYIVDVYGSANSASVVAANGLLRFLLGAAFPQFIIQLYQSRIGIHWTGSIFGFLSLALVPVPWFFFYRGRHLRRKSHYPTNSD
ncbi:hypothetical protein F5Y14DRAFT_191869 [Nemania sp. NC0429]|nr:hypothetical protein F5Y14DRAFT_191869 [Nemania sp. NC0429]